MIGSINRALDAFWNQFGVPAYQQGRVPLIESHSGERLPVDPPYIVYDVHNGEAFGVAYLTAMDWHIATNGHSGSEERALMLDRISRAIPQEGKRIDLDDGGFIMLNRGADFQSYYNDPQDRTAIAGRTAYTIKCYAM